LADGVRCNAVRTNSNTAADVRMADRRRKTLLVWWAAGVCVLALVAAIVYAQFRGWTPGRVERTVNRDLPQGSTRAEIEAYLNAKGWFHVYLEDYSWLALYGREVGLGAEQLGGVQRPVGIAQ
jgi:hypothetical protein